MTQCRALSGGILGHSAGCAWKRALCGATRSGGVPPFGFGRLGSRLAVVGGGGAPKRGSKLSIAANQQDGGKLRREIVQVAHVEPAKIKFIELAALGQGD